MAIIHAQFVASHLGTCRLVDVLPHYNRLNSNANKTLADFQNLRSNIKIMHVNGPRFLVNQNTYTELYKDHQTTRNSHTKVLMSWLIALA